MPTPAEPKMEPKMDDLKAIYDQYCAAMRNKKFEEAKPLMTEEFGKELSPPDVAPEEMAQFADMAAAMIPASYTVDHLETAGAKAALYITATMKNVEGGGTSRIEILLGFMYEASSWKLGTVNLMMDPDTVRKSPDRNYEPKESYNFDKNTSMGGRIVSVEFEKDFTLVGIRMLDEEDLVFLPAKADLEKSGLKSELLVPWKMLQVEGHPHQSNPMKIWGEKAEFVEAAPW